MTSNEPAPDQPSGLPSYGSTPSGGGSTPPPPPPGAPGGYQPAPQTNQKAIWALVLGILSLVCCGLFAGIPAIILGRIAGREIDESRGSQGGAGLAKAGFIIGIVGVVLSIITIIVYAIIFIAGISSGDFDSSTSY